MTTDLNRTTKRITLSGDDVRSWILTSQNPFEDTGFAVSFGIDVTEEVVHLVMNHADDESAYSHLASITFIKTTSDHCYRSEMTGNEPPADNLDDDVILISLREFLNYLRSANEVTFEFGGKIPEDADDEEEVAKGANQ